MAGGLETSAAQQRERHLFWVLCPPFLLTLSLRSTSGLSSLIISVLKRHSEIYGICHNALCIDEWLRQMTGMAKVCCGKHAARAGRFLGPACRHSRIKIQGGCGRSQALRQPVRYDVLGPPFVCRLILCTSPFARYQESALVRTSPASKHSSPTVVLFPRGRGLLY